MIWRHLRRPLHVLHFDDQQEEFLFQEEHQKWLPQIAVGGMTTTIFAVILSVLNHLALEQQGLVQPFRWEPHDCRLLLFVFWLFTLLTRVLAISYILWAYICKPNKVRRICENMVVLASIATSTLHPLTNPLRGPLLLGMDPQDTGASMSEILGAEATSVVIVFAHIALVSAMSIRSSKLWLHHLFVAVSCVVVRSSFESPFPGQLFPQNGLLVVVAGVSCGNVFSSECSMRQSWMAMRKSQNNAEGSQLELEQQQAKTFAMRSVLSVLFDVVLQTGGDFTLTGDNSDLSSILGEAHNTAAAGAQLLDFIIPEDRDRLLSFARDASALSVPQLMTTAFANSTGEHIPDVEVLIADTKMDGQQKYLVGLRNPPLPLDNTADPLPMDFCDEARLRREQEWREARRGRGQRHAPGSMRLRETDMTSITSMDSAASRSWRRLDICGDANWAADVFAVIDTMCQNYTITSCSAAFDTMCGTNAVGQGFLAWFADAEGFTSWLEHHANDLLNDSGRESGEGLGMHVTLRPPAILERGVELRVCVRVAHAVLDETSGHILAQLRFERCRFRVWREKAFSIRLHAL